MAVYFITDGNAVKIGYSKHFDAKARISQLQTANPRTLTVLGVISHGTREYERQLHRRLKRYKMRGEWFDYTVPDVQRVVHGALSSKRKNQRVSARGFGIGVLSMSTIGCMVTILFTGALFICCGSIPWFVNSKTTSRTLQQPTAPDVPNQVDTYDTVKDVVLEKETAAEITHDNEPSQKKKPENPGTDVMKLQQEIADLKQAILKSAFGSVRRWESSNGQFSVLARLIHPVSYTALPEQIRLKFEITDKVVTVEVARLCEKDKQYLLDLIARRTSNEKKLQLLEAELITREVNRQDP